MKSIGLIWAIALAGAASTCEAGHHFCEHCGSRQHCKKVCRVICGKKKEVKIEYDSQAEDFCIPGRSVKCGVKCECNRLGIKCCHAVLKPVCGEVRTKRVLVKKEVEKEVPDYKWVVEEVCCGCGRPIKKGEPSQPGQKAAPMAFAPPGANEGLGEAGEIEQVSAAEPLALPPPDDAEEALASDDEAAANEAAAVEPPRRRGLLQALFGQ